MYLFHIIAVYIIVVPVIIVLSAFDLIGSRPSHEIEASDQPVQDGVQTLKITWHPDRSESTHGTSLSQQDSKLSHEIEASGQPVRDGARTLKSHSIQKEATRIVSVLLDYYTCSSVNF